MADLDRRELIAQAMEQAEESTLETPEEKEIEVNDDPIQTENEANAEESHDQERDEKGRFVSSEETEPSEEIEAAQEVEHETEDPEATEEAVLRPTTWKKEYLPLWDKLDKGEALSQDEARSLLNYNVQRENEFKKGVSAYKAEADNARSLSEAIAPFVPELQKNGIHPAAWINNLGRAHMILSQAPYQQKVELFNKLAHTRD